MSNHARFATPKEIGEIMKLLFQHCQENGGFAHYSPGWNDNRIAKSVANDLGVHHVSRLRKANFGPITQQVAKPDTSTTELFEARLRLLENKVSLIEKTIRGN